MHSGVGGTRTGGVDAVPCVFISTRYPQYWRARQMSCGCCEVLEESQGGSALSSSTGRERQWYRISWKVQLQLLSLKDLCWVTMSSVYNWPLYLQVADWLEECDATAGVFYGRWLSLCWRRETWWHCSAKRWTVSPGKQRLHNEPLLRKCLASPGTEHEGRWVCSFLILVSVGPADHPDSCIAVCKAPALCCSVWVAGVLRPAWLLTCIHPLAASWSYF